jgi:anti-sigma regulatory factor (Ser/Thr protein kinase)
VSRDELSLTLPPSAEHLATARSFAASVARHFAVGEEAIEELKIAISESCVDSLVAGEPIHVRAREEAASVRFWVACPEAGDAPGRATLDELGAPARFELIRSLFPDAELVGADARREIRFSVPLG